MYGGFLIGFIKYDCLDNEFRMRLNKQIDDTKWLYNRE